MEEKSIISNEDYQSIMMELQEHHSIFYKMFELGVPTFTKDVDTAAVQFDKEGNCLRFVFNPDFWERATPYELKFIIAHECLHVIFRHGVRFKHAVMKNLINIAADIVVNHCLIRDFGFDRQRLSFQKSLCWVDTVFPNEKVHDNKTVEFYYKKLMKDAKIVVVKGKLKGGDVSVVNHDYLKDLEDLGAELVDGGELEDLLESTGNSEKECEKEIDQISDLLNKFSEGGSHSSTSSKTLHAEYKPRKKWEDIIQKWDKKPKPAKIKRTKTKLNESETWIQPDRRFATISTDMFLPSTMVDEGVWNYYDDVTPEKGKDKGDVKDLQLWFFMDVSGSCISYIDHFYAALKSIDFGVFTIRAFAFDTQVREIPITHKPLNLSVGGGTRFDIIEEFICQSLSNGNSSYPYPAAIFIITDGDGSTVTPFHPDRWYWFLVGNKNRMFIHAASHDYDLEDFFPRKI